MIPGRLTLYFRRTGSGNMELLIPANSTLDHLSSEGPRDAWDIEPPTGGWPNDGRHHAVNAHGGFPAFTGIPTGKVYKTDSEHVPLNLMGEWVRPLEWPENAADMERCDPEELQRVFGGCEI